MCLKKGLTIAPYFYTYNNIKIRKRKDTCTKFSLRDKMERGGAMASRLTQIPAGSCGVVVKARKSPRLQAIGLVPGAEVRCKYKSQGTMVLEIGNRWIALRRKALRGVWVDY
jgi:Fe2+ transport system protein FeoA